MRGYTEEDVREALAAVERWGGVDDKVDSEGIVWTAINARRAMLKGLEAAERSRARRESRSAMEALDLRVAAFKANREVER